MGRRAGPRLALAAGAVLIGVLVLTASGVVDVQGPVLVLVLVLLVATWAVWDAPRQAARQARFAACLQRSCNDPRQHLLSAERLLIRPPSTEDASAFAGSLDAVVCRWQGYTDELVEQWKVQFAWVVSAATPEGCPLWLAVYDRESGGRFAGIYTITADPGSSTADLGWWLGPDSRGRGLGRESLAMVIAYVHEHLRVHRVTMGTTTENRRAMAQIASTGATLVREAPHRLPNGERVAGSWFEHLP